MLVRAMVLAGGLVVANVGHTTVTRSNVNSAERRAENNPASWAFLPTFDICRNCTNQTDLSEHGLWGWTPWWAPGGWVGNYHNDWRPGTCAAPLPGDEHYSCDESFALQPVEVDRLIAAAESADLSVIESFLRDPRQRVFLSEDGTRVEVIDCAGSLFASIPLRGAAAE